MHWITQKFLESLADAIDVLWLERDRTLDPTISLISSFFLTGVVSFSRNIEIPLLMILFSIFLMIFLRVEIKLVLKPVAFVGFITFFVALPLPFIIDGQKIIIHAFLLDISLTREGIMEALILFLRAIASAFIFSVILIHLGWRRIVEGLLGLRFPRKLVLMMMLMIKYIPIFARDLCKILGAREARIVSKSYFRTWKILSTLVGDTIVRGAYLSWKLQLAFRARGFELSLEKPKIRIGMGEILLLLSSGIFILISLCTYFLIF